MVKDRINRTNNVHGREGLGMRLDNYILVYMGVIAIIKVNVKPSGIHTTIEVLKNN